MDPSQPKLLDLVRAVIRSKHYSRRTEETYIDWITRYVRFHKTRHPRELGSADIAAFLTHLAVDLDVAAATQNQARSALLFLYREVLGIAIDAPENVRVLRQRNANSGMCIATMSARSTRSEPRRAASVSISSPICGTSCDVLSSPSLDPGCLI